MRRTGWQALARGLSRIFVGLVSIVVPGSRRRQWRAEWTAEVDASSAPARDLLARTAGCVAHAWWMRGLHWNFAFTDVRYALRVIRRQPGFAAVVIGTLALGIGGATAMFSVVHGVVVKPLPYHAPDRLVWMFGAFSANASAAVSPPDFLDYRAGQDVFESLGAMMIGSSGGTLEATGSPQVIQVARTSAGLLTTLGVPLALGRDFDLAEEYLSSPQVAVISHRLWREQFRADPGIIGKAVRIDRVSRTVVGVMPPELELPFDPNVKLSGPIDVVLPLPFDAPETTVRRFHFLRLIGRLKPGVTIELAQERMDVIARDLEARYSENETWRLRLVPLHERMVGAARPILATLMGAVGLVLMVACANVASLVLARATSRHGEFSLRTALGASRARLIRQVVAEGLVMSLSGAALGLIGAAVTLRLLRHSGLPNMPRLDGVTLEPAAVWFAVGAAVLATLISALLPAWHVIRPSLMPALKEARGAVPAGSMARTVIVTAQVALALVLLIGAGLLGRSLHRLQSVEVGFATSGVLLTPIALPPEIYGASDKSEGFFTGLSARLSAIPGVAAAGLTTSPPLVSGNDVGVHREDEPPQSQAERRSAQIRWVQGAFFDALSVPLLGGRHIDDSIDRPGAPYSAVISQRMAQQFFPDRNPVGQRLVIGLRTPITAEVVGVVADTRVFGQASAEPALLYVSARQSPTLFMYAIVRTQLPIDQFSSHLRRALGELDSSLGVARVESMDDLLRSSVAQPRFRTGLIVAFAIMALTLTAVGVFGLLAHAVSRRSREIGVRLALGARPSQVVWLVFRQGAILVGSGLAIGVALALTMSPVVEGMLFDVAPRDPWVIVTATVFLAAVAAGALVIPSRRAAGVNPVTVLRLE